MTCKIENGFYWLVCFHYEYFRTQKLKNVVFQINWHVWANTVLKCGCIHTETLLSEIVTGFYWLICFNSWNIRKSCFWSKIILLSSFWKVGMFSLFICLLWQRWVACKIENGFNWLIYIHCEYLSVEKFENNVFQAKIMYLSRHSFKQWAYSILKLDLLNRHALLYSTEMHSMEDRKWFLVAHLLSVSIYDWSKVPKYCFLTKIINLSRHSFEQWAWQVLDFT